MSRQDDLLPTTSALRRELEEATKRYESSIFPFGTMYLESRGIDPDAVAGFRLGVVDDPMPGHEAYVGRLAIPYLNHDDGHVIGMKFRCMEDHSCKAEGCAKYMSWSGIPTHIYNAQAMKSSDGDINITEGEMDSIVMTIAGFASVAFPGATQWRPWHRRLFQGFNRVYVWGDPDQAGREFSLRIKDELDNAVIVPIAGGDVNEVYLQGGADALHEILEEA